MVDKNKDGIPDGEIIYNGKKVSTKTLFPDDASRLDFHTKLKLATSPSSGEDDGMQGMEGVSEALFAPKKKKTMDSATQEPDF